MFEQLLSSIKSSPGYNPFQGEVLPADFIDGVALAANLGLTAGVAINNDQPWLHFKTTDGREFYVAKKHYRHSVNWNNLITVGAVSGTKSITIGDKVYSIKLITGGTSATQVPNDWVDYVQGICVDDPKRRQWASYTLSDLEINEGATTYVTLCQETAAANNSNCALRGLWAIDAWNMNNKSTGGVSRGWRPFLELVP